MKQNNLVEFFATHRSIHELHDDINGFRDKLIEPILRESPSSAVQMKRRIEELQKGINDGQVRSIRDAVELLPVSLMDILSFASALESKRHQIWRDLPLEYHGLPASDARHFLREGIFKAGLHEQLEPRLGGIQGGWVPRCIPMFISGYFQAYMGLLFSAAALMYSVKISGIVVVGDAFAAFELLIESIGFSLAVIDNALTLVLCMNS